MEDKTSNKKTRKGKKQMVNMTIFAEMLSNFYFSKYLLVASAIYGVFRLVEMLILNKR